MSAPSGFEKAGKGDCPSELMRGAPSNLQNADWNFGEKTNASSMRSGASERIVAEALTWIGTPYRHQASLKGIGCDCIGLVRGVWRSVSGEDIVPAPYTPDWAEVGGEEVLLDGLSARFEAVDLAAAHPGDVLVFRMRPRSPAKHAAILSEGAVDEARATIIHAYWGHAVVQSWLGPVWRKHVMAAFRFPKVEAVPSVGFAATSPASRGGE